MHAIDDPTKIAVYLADPHGYAERPHGRDGEQVCLRRDGSPAGGPRFEVDTCVGELGDQALGPLEVDHNLRHRLLTTLRAGAMPAHRADARSLRGW
ncbi:MAG: hypothetical protein ACRD0U_15555, partial [Acidimicrobiales bacterium]